MADLIFTSIELGLLYSILVLGVFLTFRILDFPDLTVDGSFVTGAGAGAIAMHAGVPGFGALFVGLIAGFLAGSLTAILHTRFGIGKILSGILALSMLYTINLRLMGGPNISLLNEPQIISILKTPIDHWHLIIFLAVIVLVTKFLIDWFLQTEFGLTFRATGSNEMTAPSFSINPNRVKFVGLGISNALVGFTGALLSQYQGFVDINMGIGNILSGLAALMLGEAIIRNGRVPIMTTAVVIGTICYELAINIALRLGLAGTDLKFVTAAIVILAIVLGGKKYGIFTNKAIA